MAKVKINKPMKVLVLSSYCDRETCSDDLPCDECLKMCNISEIPSGTELDVIGGLDYLRDRESK